MKQWFQDLSPNLFSGFVVSLIALPLSLGLALASGAPPVAGIIAAIVGGLVISFLGGSYVGIAGPGNGLVVATLGAILALGDGDMVQGFLYTLAAIVVSGGVIFLLGLFKVGVVGDFFPSAAVQGMLAAIGLIIMSKQLHVMLGEINPVASSATELFALLPATLERLFIHAFEPLAWLTGLGSLLILVLHSFVKTGIVRKFPAPVLAVGYAILLNYLASIEVLPFPTLQAEYLIRLPENIVKQLATPDFSKAGEYTFFMAVFSLTFIATTESLLSIKAIDKLDPKRRRSNVNRELRAIGLATVVSGFMGGLNPVIAIARSSVNVNNGATWRSSNFFQAFFLAGFVLLFPSFLNRIPLPALAAILVFTGYRLASPQVFQKIASVGLEQLIIFSATLLATLFTDLITGIACGMLLTLLMQLNTKDRAAVILRNFFKPNTLLFLESSGQYHLSVRAFSNFTNYVRLKKRLDTLPTNAALVVDFSLCQFVDYSVLEHLGTYRDSFEKSGGNLEIIGLDDLTARTAHPLAPRKKPHRWLPNRNSRRQDAISTWFKERSWSFHEDEHVLRKKMLHFRYFADKQLDGLRNVAVLKEGEGEVWFADLDYSQGELLTKSYLHTSAVLLTFNFELPFFVLDKENVLHRTAVLAGWAAQTNLENFSDFTNNFKLKVENEEKIKEFFTWELVAFFEAHKPYHIESHDKQLLIFEKQRLATFPEFTQLINFATGLSKLLQNR